MKVYAGSLDQGDIQGENHSAAHGRDSCGMGAGPVNMYVL